MRPPRVVGLATVLVAGLVLGASAGPAADVPAPGIAPADIADADIAAVDIAAVDVPAVIPDARPAQPPPPPVPDTDALAGVASGPRPLPGVRPTTACVTSAAGASAVDADTLVPWAQQQLRFTDAWRFTRGEGQLVAVIDTGVSPHPRLAGRLLDGGDFVADEGGLVDCDGHGTLVAGIIAADAGGSAGFAGVAPEARVLSIRQSSGTVSALSPDGRVTDGGGDVGTLAAAVLHAVRLGATVINISQAACVPAANAARSLAPLRAAVRSAVDADRVVVAAAGNAGSGSCRQGGDGSDQVVAPAWFGDDVLSVGYTRRDGQPAPASIRGPWVTLSAPGSEIVSLDPAGPGVIDRITPAGTGTPSGIEGTSFAAPYVSGVVALVRARYPELSAREVMARVRETATSPAGGERLDDAVGVGAVDPLAAVAQVRPGGGEGAALAAGPVTSSDARGRVDLTAARDAHSRPRSVALVGSAVAVGLLAGIGFAVLVARRSRRSR